MIAWASAYSLLDNLPNAHVKHFAGVLHAARTSARVEVKVGQVLQIDTPPIDGRRPALGIVGFRPPDGYATVLVPVDRSDNNNGYRAVRVGSVDIGGISRDRLDYCYERRCVDLMGEWRFIVSVVVTR